MLRDAVAAVCVLIIVLVVALLVVRSGRNRGQGGAGGRARTRGQHENRRPAAGDTGAIRRPQPIRPGRPASPGWASPAGWQGGGIGEIRPILDASSHPAVAPAPRTGYSHRASRGAGRSDRDSGPPWAPAPQPKRLLGPLPVASAGSPPPEPGRGIRLPGDMAAPADAAAAPPPPAGFDLSPPADFDLSTAAFGLTPPAFGMAPPAFDAAPPDPAVARAEALPTRQDLGFAAAPVPADYSAPLTGGGPGPADPSYIWDLAATDVFPAATDAVVTRDDTSEADGS